MRSSTTSRSTSNRPQTPRGLTLVPLGDNGTGKTTLPRRRLRWSPTRRSPTGEDGALHPRGRNLRPLRGGDARRHLPRAHRARRRRRARRGRRPRHLAPFVVAHGCRRNAATGSADGDEMTPPARSTTSSGPPERDGVRRGLAARLKAASQARRRRLEDVARRPRRPRRGCSRTSYSLDFDARAPPRHPQGTGETQVKFPPRSATATSPPRAGSPT